MLSFYCTWLKIRFNYKDLRYLYFQNQDDLIKQLIDELKDVTDWHTLGLRLKIKPSVLEEVEMNNRDATGMKRAMLKQWLRSTEATWKGLVSALRNMDENCTARNIEEKCCETSRYTWWHNWLTRLAIASILSCSGYKAANWISSIHTYTYKNTLVSMYYVIWNSINNELEDIMQWRN